MLVVALVFVVRRARRRRARQRLTDVQPHPLFMRDNPMYGQAPGAAATPTAAAFMRDNPMYTLPAAAGPALPDYGALLAAPRATNKYGMPPGEHYDVPRPRLPLGSVPAPRLSERHVAGGGGDAAACDITDQYAHLPGSFRFAPGATSAMSAETSLYARLDREPSVDDPDRRQTLFASYEAAAPSSDLTAC